MNVKPTISATLAVLVLCGLASAAAAADGPYFAWGPSGPWPYVRQSVYVDQQPPYFAVHPPVYYSFPVSRTYGLLPYPYLPHPLSREVSPPQPAVVYNPYVAHDPAQTPAASSGPTGPQLITNPYVVGADSGTASPEARLTGRVQTTHPAAMFE